ncbi:MAG TPA: CoA transferase [Thermoanaerobaculia bacterium]|nr:CoA transferase [Thermoanaerobaculia bacterium]
MTRSRLPLADVLVADFSRVLAGPLCTQLLADYGARVIKIEEPSRGDETRRWGPPFIDGVSAYFLAVNRNKESIAIDMKSAEGRKVAKKLIARADVIVDNFLPAQRQSLGIRRHARAIHCSITGFDPDTAEANRPGYDLLAQAGSGLMAITGEKDGEPMKAGVALSDVLTAHYAAGAICTALYAREKTGRGERIEISLFGATVASLVNVAQNALVTGGEPSRWGNAHTSIVPYQVFHGSDRAFAIGGGTDRHFEALCEVIRRPDLLRFATNASRVEHRGELVPLLDAIFRAKPARVWVDACRRAAIPVAMVQGVREALESDAGRVLVVALDHPRIGRFETVRNPLLFSGKRFPIRSAPPELGQHTQEILRELGITSRSSTRPAARRNRRA